MKRRSRLERWNATACSSDRTCKPIGIFKNNTIFNPRRKDILNPKVEQFRTPGPNGAGKSAAILMLVGLLRPTSCAGSIGGVEVATHPVAVKKRS